MTDMCGFIANDVGVLDNNFGPYASRILSKVWTIL